MPVIGTLKHLVETGDKVEKVEGIFRYVCLAVKMTMKTGKLCAHAMLG